MTIHVLKIDRNWFDDIATGKKNFEIRKNDRGYSVGDYLDIRCQLEKEELRIVAIVTYMITHDQFPQGIKTGYCVMGIEQVKDGGA